MLFSGMIFNKKSDEILKENFVELIVISDTVYLDFLRSYGGRRSQSLFFINVFFLTSAAVSLSFFLRADRDAYWAEQLRLRREAAAIALQARILTMFTLYYNTKTKLCSHSFVICPRFLTSHLPSIDPDPPYCQTAWRGVRARALLHRLRAAERLRVETEAVSVIERWRCMCLVREQMTF
jgi:hypothetical protein